MKLIIGLGNPGEKYKDNRHNVGFMVIDKLYKSKILIFKSQNFMNDSGRFVKKLCTQYNIQTPNLWVIHDDLDIKLGDYKIQFGKGPKDHKGLNDVYEKLGTKDFWHVRIGVENRDPQDRVSGEEYVLQDFSKEEKAVIDSVIQKLTKDMTNKVGK